MAGKKQTGITKGRGKPTAKVKKAVVKGRRKGKSKDKDEEDLQKEIDKISNSLDKTYATKSHVTKLVNLKDDYDHILTPVQKARVLYLLAANAADLYDRKEYAKECIKVCESIEESSTGHGDVATWKDMAEEIREEDDNDDEEAYGCSSEMETED